jgi:WD40 repeat protein
LYFKNLQKCISSLLQAADDTVAAVDFNNDILITGSEDSSLAVWSMDTFDKMDVLNGHNGGITGVQVEL